jgi:hypothetical protein
MTPQPAPGITGPVLLVVTGGAVSQAAIARTAELAAGAPVTVVGVGANDISRTDPCYTWPAHPTHPGGREGGVSGVSGATRPGASPTPAPRAGLAGGSVGSSPRAGTQPEQLRRTVALAMSVLENTGVMATGHIVTGSPARAVARVARARGARVVILDQPGPGAGGQPARPGTGRGSAGTGGAGRGSAGRGGAGAAGLVSELRRRMYGSGIVVLAETDRRGGWVSA